MKKILEEDKNHEFNEKNNKSSDNGKNSVAINSGEDNKRFLIKTANPEGENVEVVNGKGFLNEKELDMDLSHSVSILYTNLFDAFLKR